MGRPVNVTNGNVYIEQTDYRLPGFGAGLEVTRTYNSKWQRAGIFGYGWSTAFDESITPYGTTLVRLNLADGRAVYLGAAAVGEPFLPKQPVNFPGQVLKNADNTYTLTFKDGRVHQFNASGKIVSFADRNNNTVTLTYDANGNPVTVTDAAGRTLTLSYDSYNKVGSIADSTGTIATYTHASFGRLLSVTYADGSKFIFTIKFGTGITNYITVVKDALNNVVESHTYDAQWRALTSEVAGNGTERYSLSYVSDSETQVTDALGRVTRYFFDKSRGRNLVTRIEGNCSCGGAAVQTWTYDEKLNILSHTNANNQTTTYTHDQDGNPLTETNSLGTTTWTYNSFGQVLTAADPLGGVTTSTYDGQGNLLSVKNALNHTTTFSYGAQGQLLTVTDPRNNTTAFTYDTNGNLTRRTDALNNQTNIAYDARGRVTTVTNALNQVTSYEYDLAGRLKKVIYLDTNFVLFTYDLAGRRTKIRDPRGYETTFAYDAAYRLISQTDAANHTTSFAHDLMSNLTSTTDALGRVTNYEYDDFNRLKKVIYPPASTGATRLDETITYDALGNVTKRTDTAGRDTTYLYDTIDRLTRITDPALQITQFEYNARSQTTKVIDAFNQQYLFTYDALGRVTQTTRAGVSMSFAYDSVGNGTQRTDYNGAVTNYTFDALNRLTSIAYPDLTNATYGYDALSRLTSAANQNGTVTFGYDSRNGLTSTTDVWGQTIGYSYDANGNRSAMTVGGAAYSSYQYDAVNRLTNLADSASQNFAYSYDAVNRLTTRSAPNGVTANFSYDGLDRLLQLSHTKPQATLALNQYSYNNANNIASWLDPSGTRTFNYDAADRLTTVVNGGNESYSYDAVGNRTSSHLSTSYSYQPFNQLTSTTTATYAYDSNGNVLTKTDAGGTRTFGWDSENRLKQVVLPGGLTVSDKYDALGRRIQRTTSAGADERYVYDGQDVLMDLNSSLAVTTSYINGLGIDDHLRQTNTSTGVSYFLTDHLGTTTALTDATGNVVETLAYDSFGNNSGSTRTRYTYTGRERDPDTGLLYYRARFYDPQLGRFISEDPLGLAGGLNLFAYVENNPMLFADPYGLCPQNPRQDFTKFLQTMSQDCKDALTKAGLLGRVISLANTARVYDVNSIQNALASRYVDGLARRRETLGQWFDRTTPSGGAHTAVRVPRSGIYIRGGESAFAGNLYLELHEFTHLAYPRGRDLDASLGRRLGLTKGPNESWSDAVTRFFNSKCTQKTP